MLKCNFSWTSLMTWVFKFTFSWTTHNLSSSMYKHHSPFLMTAIGTNLKPIYKLIYTMEVPPYQYQYHWSTSSSNINFQYHLPVIWRYQHLKKGIKIYNLQWGIPPWNQALKSILPYPSHDTVFDPRLQEMMLLNSNNTYCQNVVNPFNHELLIHPYIFVRFRNTLVILSCQSCHWKSGVKRNLKNEVWF